MSEPTDYEKLEAGQAKLNQTDSEQNQTDSGQNQTNLEQNQTDLKQNQVVAQQKEEGLSLKVKGILIIVAVVVGLLVGGLILFAKRKKCDLVPSDSPLFSAPRYSNRHFLKDLVEVYKATDGYLHDYNVDLVSFTSGKLFHDEARWKEFFENVATKVDYLEAADSISRLLFVATEFYSQSLANLQDKSVQPAVQTMVTRGYHTFFLAQLKVFCILGIIDTAVMDRFRADLNVSSAMTEVDILSNIQDIHTFKRNCRYLLNTMLVCSLKCDSSFVDPFKREIELFGGRIGV